ncbi:phage minor capsid protein [Alkalibacterium sp. MB6]|uniref:phage minor capsid protein n=1 Tax=Alkalibacterium sp. MB6 TaxID=2081965 RepID=UPI00137B3E9C|nr:phage minor capsid protein [Alkalibacterium sp. MB6]
MAPITPRQLDIWSSEIAHLYQSLEGEIIKLIIQRIKKSGIDSVAQWQLEYLRDLRLLNTEVAEMLAEVTSVAEEEVLKRFEQAELGAIESVDSALSLESASIPTRLDNVMRGYYNQAWSGIDNLVNQTLVSTNYEAGSVVTREYTDILNRTSSLFNTGIYTQEEAVKKAVQEMAQRGIRSTFVDKGGHTWSLERYTRTIMKSTLGNTYNEVKKERMEEFGIHTVVVTSHMGARAECARIQGNVVDLRYPSELPIDSAYKSIYDPDWGADYGEPGGHRGVNCRHDHIPFIPGVNTNNQPSFDQAKNKEVAKAQTKQRELERRIVKYKKNLMISEEFGSDDVQHWKSLVSKSQKAMRVHLKENGEYLSRNYEREKVYTPLDTLIKDF